MGIVGLPGFVLDHLTRIAQQEGFIDGYDVQHESGSKVGDGCMATMLAIKLSGYRRMEPTSELEMDELALVCKVQPSNVARQENFSSELVFRREVYVYTKLLPALVAFQKLHGIPDREAFTGFPKCHAAFHEDGNSESLIIMEDLRAAGFEMKDKTKPTQFQNVSLLMQQIGRLHGLSFAIRHQNPRLFQEFKVLPPILIESFTTPGVTSIIQATYANAIALMDDRQDVEDLTSLGKNFTQIFAGSLDEELLGEYGVVGHGDCWTNNTMFQMENGSAKAITFVDWQMARYTSPAIDLSQYLFTSTDKPFRAAHLDELLNVYYTNLAHTIRATGSDPDVLFPEAELQRQLRLFGGYGAILAPIMMSIVIADVSEITNVDEMAEKMATGAGNSGTMAMLSDAKARAYAQRLSDVLADIRRFGWS